jgi:murein L,D-transpeptidase YafK
LIRATVVRALVLTAAFAGALTPVQCLGEDGNQLPIQATMALSRELLSLLQQTKMPKHSPILVRIFKEESELELWKQDTTGHFQLLKTYPICRWSGDLGPKLHEGDRQAPEGFYTITPELMNPNSNYYLAINTGFPNGFDKANDRDGTFLMIHGDCWSSGCYAMTDEQMGEIYALARESLAGDQPSFQVQAYPFRLTPANLARHRTNPNMPFWAMLKEGNDHFLVSHLEPKVDVCERRYVFDAQPPNSSKPLVFDPTGKCPAFVVHPKIAQPALQKQHADEVEYKQLVKDNVSVAPIYSGLDGGMNQVFLARFPGRIIPLAIVLPPIGSRPPQLPSVPWADNYGSLTSKFFGTLFGSKPPSPTQVALTDPTTREGGAASATAGSTDTLTTKPVNTQSVPQQRP